MIIEILTNHALLTNTETAATTFLSFFPAMMQTAKTTPTIIFLFILFLICTLVPLLLAALTIHTWWQNKKLLIKGEPAQAKILKIWDTGVTLNDDPQVGMLLEVHAKDRPPFQGEAKRFVSRLKIPLIQVGAAVEVRFDPQDTSRIAVVL